MTTNFRVKIGEIGLFTFIRRFDIPKRIKNRSFTFKSFNMDDLATLCRNLVNFGPVTPEFNRAKMYTPRQTVVVWLGGATDRPCEDQY